MSKHYAEKNIEEFFSFDDVLLKPRFSDLTENQVDISTHISDSIKLRIPIIASPMDTVCGGNMALELGKAGGLGIIHRNQSIAKQVLEVKRVLNQNIAVGAAVGLSSDFDERVKNLVKAGVNILSIDYSIGHSHKAIQAAVYIKKKYRTEVMTANIATPESIRDYLSAGIKIFRYGTANGSACISSLISGVGLPLFSAIYKAQPLLKQKDICLVADGGIRNSGNIIKALAVGARAVMLGNMLAGTKEAPGKIFKIGGKKYKMYRGMGSVSAMKKGSMDRYDQKYINQLLYPEGIEGFVEYKGNLTDIIENILYGIRSAMMRIGAKNLEDLRSKAEFIRITPINFNRFDNNNSGLIDK